MTSNPLCDAPPEPAAACRDRDRRDQEQHVGDAARGGPERFRGCCRKRPQPLGSLKLRSKEEEESLLAAERLLANPRDKRDEEAIRAAQRFGVGGLAIAAALQLLPEAISSNPGALINEAAVNQDFATWLAAAVKDPGAAEASLHALAATVGHVADVLPLIGPLIAAVRAWRSGGTRKEILNAAAMAAFHGFVASLIIKFVVVPLVGEDLAKAVASVVMSGSVNLMEFEAACCGGCCEDCCIGCDCGGGCVVS